MYLYFVCICTVSGIGLDQTVVMKVDAVEILGDQYVLSRAEIKKVSKKWSKRTAKSETKWPKEGTFDVVVCEEMEVLIKNYKPNGKGKKAIEKRERERIILGMFKKHGELFRQTARTARDLVTRDKEGTSARDFVLGDRAVETDKIKPPPYNTGLYPLVTGTVDIKGEVTIDEESKVQESKKGKDAHIHMDCYKQVKEAKHRRRKVSSSEEDTEEESDSDSESDRKVTGRKSTAKTRGKAGKRTGKSKRKGEEEVSQDKEEEEEGSKASSSSVVTEVQEDGMSKRSTKKKTQQSCSGAFPILIRGGHAHYVPWGSQDLEGLILRLPNIHDGATKWIGTFEEHTVGKMLAVGDIKALLARVLGIAKMRSLLENGVLACWLDEDMDGTTFDTYRPNAWNTLRAEYPTHIDSKRLEGHKLNDTENPASFLQKESVRWRLETEKDPETDALVSQMFRKAMLQAIPAPVRHKLEDVVGLLTSHTHKQFNDQLVHAVDRHRINEERKEEQTKEVRRKLDQSTLEEITQRGKDTNKTG